jgi:DNA polymerase-3 subunit alpha
LAKDAIGHEQIRELSTRAWLRSYLARGMRRVPTYYNDLFEVIGKNPGHVIGSTACLGGVLATQLLKEKTDETLNPKIYNWIRQINDLFGTGNFFFEMQPSYNKEQIYVNQRLFELSEELAIPYIITTDSHYLKKEDRIVHKAYLNAQNGDREVDDFYATTYMMNTEELESYFSYFSAEQLKKAYQNILKIKESCQDFTLLKPLRIPELMWYQYSQEEEEYFFYKEKIPYLETFYNSDYFGDRRLVWAIIDGIKNRRGLQTEEAYKEIDVCLDDTWRSSIKNKAHWSAYYLNLQKNIDLCWEAGSLVGPGRGSGAGFILLYVLGITQINPLLEETQVFHWRFLNPERASVLDCDTDIEGSRRAQVLQKFRDFYGEDRVSNVATFKTEKSKSAILTACRGLKIDVDIASYLASLIPSDRGQLRSLSQCMNGDEDKGFKPIKQFVFEMTENYPEVWNVASKIEGLICGIGVHAGGVIFVDESFTKSTALMRAPDGTIITAFELHDCEKCSLIKIDMLSIEALDKIHNELDLLVEYNYIKPEKTLKETYEKVIGIYNLERTTPEMWKMVWEHKISSLFQMEKQSGINGIALTHPKSVKELAVLNSVIRLMAPEKGAEQPLDMWARYRSNIDDWKKEMILYGLSQDNIDWLMSHGAITDGICESQEGMMQLLQEERLGGNDLTFADKCRKAIAKKVGKLFDECEKTYFENAQEKKCDMKLVHYVWDILLRVQRGYSFCRAHTLSYSLVALQEMNLAYRFPIIFWNCACLISDSGGNETEDNEENFAVENEMEEFNSTAESFTNDDSDDEDEDEEEGIAEKKKKKKKKQKTTNYGKISTAIGKMKMANIEVTSPDINKSTYTFSPDVENNIIRFGMNGITKIGEDLVKNIITNRPYSSIQDFLSKVKINKTQMINLIKCGAFDSFGKREDIMEDYVNLISDTKSVLNLRNMQMLINFNLIPDDFDMVRRVFNFNKYLKKFKVDNVFLIDNIAMNFIDKNFNIDNLQEDNRSESGFAILQTKWKKIYDSYMNKIRPYIKDHNKELLDAVNNRLTAEVREKYTLGSISKWEMDSVSCYFHEHELKNVDYSYYGFSNYFELPENPEVDTVLNIRGKKIPLFKIHRICGTVLDRDKLKKTITLLTREGVVTVRIFGDVFNHYDRQISERGADGKKHVVQKSFFSRGNKIIVTGIKREDSFQGKKYKSTPYHLVELIKDIKSDGTLITEERLEVD